MIDNLQFDTAPHAACARSFFELLKWDKQRAWEIYVAANRRLTGGRPTAI
jgi:hypothetical protein